MPNRGVTGAMGSFVPGVRASARRVIFSIGAASALLGAAPGAVLADLVGVDAVAEDAARAVVGTADGVASLVTGAIASGSSGARAYFKDRSPRKLSVQKTEDLALQRNLDIKVQRLRVRQAEQSVVGTEAALDPNLAYAINVDVSKNYERSDTFTRVHEKVIDFDKLENDFKTIAEGGVPVSPEPCVIVDGKVINDSASGANPACDAVDEFGPIQDFASFKTATLPIWNFSFSPSKNLRPGGQVVVNLNTEYKKRLGTSIGFFDNPISADNPLGNGHRYAWASSIKFIAALPFPYMRNFGEHGNPVTVSIALAKEALETQKWVYAGTTNATRASAQSLYWNVVNSVLQLRTNIRHRGTLEKLYESAKRLFDQRQITKYDLLQAETNLQRANAREEAAWGNYLKASNALVELLDLGREVYIVPAGFVHDLQQSYEVDARRALESAYKNRPELRAAQSAVTTSNINFRFRKIDTRPALTLNVSYDLQQDNAILGYRDPIDSLLNVVAARQGQFLHRADL